MIGAFTILYADNEESVQESTLETLNKYALVRARTKDEILKKVADNKVDLLIVDLDTPKINGVALISQLREQKNNLHIIATASSKNIDHLSKLIDKNLKAYLVRPYNQKELETLIDNLAKPKIVAFKRNFVRLSSEVSYNKTDRQIALNGELMYLTQKEQILFDMLLAQQERVIPYKELEKKVWKNKPVVLSSLRTLVKLLRQKLPQDAIENVSGLGYKLRLTAI